MNKMGFSVLKYQGDTPVLAVWAWCPLKFLTPAGMKNWQTASDYLWNKYLTHRCAAVNAPHKDGIRVTTIEIHAARKPFSKAG